MMAHSELKDSIDMIENDEVDDSICMFRTRYRMWETLTIFLDLIAYSRCLRLIQRTMSASGMSQLVNERARQGRIPGVNSLECWSELRHHMSRLLAYEQTVEDLFAAEGEWPELFRDFEILPIPSSRTDANPLGRKSENAHSIFVRMTSDPEKKAKYRALAAELERVDLNVRIKNQCEKATFRPCVHAEVLVLDWVTANCPIPEFQFFQRIKYIGSSKPTCKLCNYYFGAHPSRVKPRSTHGNLYLNWKFPDVYEADGPKGIKRRTAIYYSMLENIRNDAFQIMEEKGATWKRHDSNTYSIMTARQTNLTFDDLT